MIDQKQLENVEYFNCLGSMITNYAGCTHEIKSRIAMAKTAFNKKNTLFTSKVILNLRKKLSSSKVLHLEHSFIWCWNLALQKVDQKYLERFEMWCWWSTQNISWTDRVRNEKVLQRVKEERNVLQTMKRRMANWISHILCRNCLLKHVIEGKMEGRM
jgi:hypothetical protein